MCSHKCECGSVGQFLDQYPLCLQVCIVRYSLLGLVKDWCSIKGHLYSASGFIFNTYTLEWVCQTPRKGLEWVACIRTKSNNYATYTDSVKDRFTISRDDSQSMVNLQMNNLKTEDIDLY